MGYEGRRVGVRWGAGGQRESRGGHCIRVAHGETAAGRGRAAREQGAHCIRGAHGETAAGRGRAAREQGGPLHPGCSRGDCGLGDFDEVEQVVDPDDLDAVVGQRRDHRVELPVRLLQPERLVLGGGGERRGAPLPPTHKNHTVPRE